MTLTEILFYPAVFTGGALCGAILQRVGGPLIDRLIGQVRLEIKPDDNTDTHGYFLATEKDGHVQEFDIFALSLNLNNQSRRPFTIVDYFVDVQFPNGKWHHLDKHEVKGNHTLPTRSLGASHRLNEQKRISDFYNHPIAKDSMVSVLVTTHLPLKMLRTHNEAKEMKYRISLKERRGFTVQKTLILRQIQSTRLTGSMR